MKYECGTEVMLGDEIMVQYGPDKRNIGTSGCYRAWTRSLITLTNHFILGLRVKQSSIKISVVVEWIEANPLSHNDPNYAPVGNYVTLSALYAVRNLLEEEK